MGPFTKAGYTNGDFHYVHGSPVMATMYGLDVLARARWNKWPDLVLSGPNEGQNLGLGANNSGSCRKRSVCSRPRPPLDRVECGVDTVDNTTLADPDSAIVANLAVRLLEELESKTEPGQPLLPNGVALNVNFPDAATSNSEFAFSRIGTFQLYDRYFPHTPPYGLGFSFNDPGTATFWQTEDEAVVNTARVSVTAMQVSFDHDAIVQDWLRRHLRSLFR